MALGDLYYATLSLSIILSIFVVGIAIFYKMRRVDNTWCSNPCAKSEGGKGTSPPVGQTSQGALRAAVQAIVSVAVPSSKPIKTTPANSYRYNTPLPATLSKAYHQP